MPKLRVILSLALSLLWFGSVPAQAQDDPGFVGRLIQDSLSGPGREVRVAGFSGALSSQAQLARMTFADDQGVWLTLENVTLDWNRSALLRRALSVNQLTAERLEITRRPVAAETGVTAPKAEASGFALPELPVTVNVESFAINEVVIGPEVLGEAATVKVEGEVGLANGEGAGRITLQRIDGVEGRLGFSVSFNNETRFLSVQGAVREASGGLIGTLLQVPGTPALALDIDGKGTLDEFVADLSVASDGAQRIAGQVTLVGNDTGATRFSATLGGDVSALVAPQYSGFFGPDVRLVATGERRSNGELALDTFDLSARSLTLNGTLTLGNAGLPTAFALNGTLQDPGGTAVRLPIAGKATVQAATLRAEFDAARGQGWSLALSVMAPSFDTYSAAQITLDGRGTIVPQAGSRAVTASVSYGFDGLRYADGTLSDSLGDRLDGQAEFAWSEGQPLVVSDLTLGGSDYGLRGTGSASLADRTLTVTGQAAVFSEDLSRFSPIAGRPLTGTAELSLSGEADLLGGIFAAALELDAQGLSIGQEVADRLLDGSVRLTTSLRRDTTGIALDRFALTSTGVNASGQGGFGPVGSVLELTVAVPDISLIAPEYVGALTVTGQVSEPRTDTFALDVALQGPYGLTGTVIGEIGAEAAGAVTLDLSLPDVAPLVPDYTGAVTVKGTAQDTGGGRWQVDLNLDGPYQSSIALQGLLGGGASDVTLDAALPDIAPLVPAYSGAVTLKGSAAEAGNGQWEVDLNATGPYRSAFAIAGRAGGGRTDVRLEGGVPDIAPFAPGLTGALALNGTAAETGEGRIRVDLELDAPYGASARVSGPVGDGRSEIALTAALPDVSPLAPGIDGAIRVEGTAAQAGDGRWRVALEATGPWATTGRVTGLVGSAGTAVDVTVRLPDVGALAPGISGAAQVSAQVQQATAGNWDITAEGSGPFASTFSGSARIAPGATDVSVTASVPDLGAVTPALRGAARVQARAQQAPEGAWDVTADATGPYRSTLGLQGRYQPGRSRVTVTAALPDIGPLAPGLAGALRLTGSATEAEPGAWAVDAQVLGPYQTTAAITGRLAAGASALDFRLAVPNIAPLAPGLSGSIRATGTARETDLGYAVELTSEGPGSATARIAGTLAPDLRSVNLTARGDAPLALANQILAPREIDGLLRFDLTVNGPPTLASVRGTASTRGARLAAPTLAQTLRGIDATVTLNGGTAQVSVTAQPDKGGRLGVTGSVRLSPGAPVLDLTLSLENLVIEDPTLYRTMLDGTLRISGPLRGGGVIAGQISIARTEFSIPSGGLGFGGSVPRMTHINEPTSVHLTRVRARAVAKSADTGTREPGAVFALDVRISAPNQIYIRGRGLDLELGGSMRVGGTTADPQPVGGIQVIRGRLNLLGKRLEFSQDGQVTLSGDLTPYLDLSATSQSDEFLIVIRITGPIDAPVFSFTSEPPLPEDEVIARLLFGRDLTSLSPFQAAQLAASIAELTGAGGGGLLGGFRSGLGLDELDVRTDAEGQTQVTLGKYLSENIYTDVTAGGDGTTSIRLNIDITADVKVSGKVGSDGDSSIGIYYERDY